MKRQQDAVRFGSSAIKYTVARSAKRNSVALTVHPDGDVQVTAPRGTRRTVLAKEVLRKATWILEQQEFFRRQAPSYPKLFVSGESFAYLGRQYKLKVRTRGGLSKPQTELTKGQFLVTLPSETERGERSPLVKKELTKWYRCRAKDIILPILEAYASKLGVSYDSVNVRDMTKRWGSGGSDRRIAFNWRIVMAPRRLVEYVVAHELCHLFHDDHSRDFWRLMGRVMPDHERRRLTLAVNGAKFGF